MYIKKVIYKVKILHISAKTITIEWYEHAFSVDNNICTIKMHINGVIDNYY